MILRLNQLPSFVKLKQEEIMANQFLVLDDYKIKDSITFNNGLPLQTVILFKSPIISGISAIPLDNISSALNGKI